MTPVPPDTSGPDTPGTAWDDVTEALLVRRLVAAFPRMERCEIRSRTEHAHRIVVESLGCPDLGATESLARLLLLEVAMHRHTSEDASADPAGR